MSKHIIKTLTASVTGIVDQSFELIRPRLAAAVVLAALAWHGQASATPMDHTWTMSAPSASYGPYYGNTLEFSASEDPSRTLKLTGYSSSAHGALMDTAHIQIYSGGIGVRNQFGDGGSPNHAIDNSGHNDFLLFEFDADDFTPESFRIGWWHNDSDIRIWVGGPTVAGLDLTTASVAGLSGLGFTQLPDFWNVPVNTSIDIGTSLAGRYMIVAGADEYYKDYFKFKQIVAEVSEESHDVNEPATLAIFGLGLAGLGYMRRRRAA